MTDSVGIQVVRHGDGIIFVWRKREVVELVSWSWKVIYKTSLGEQSDHVGINIKICYGSAQS